MRLARHCFRALAVCATIALCACAPQASPARAQAPRCANTFVHAITSSQPTPGVWDCLTSAYQSRLQGEGDNVFALDVPLWTGYRYLGQDRNIALYELTVNERVDASVYNPPVMHVIMAVYIDGTGYVDHAKAATPT
jgi:hypothetical protein